MALVVPVVNEMHWGILMLLPIVLALPALEREQEKERQTVKKESFCVVQLSQSHQPEKKIIWAMHYTTCKQQTLPQQEQV